MKHASIGPIAVHFPDRVETNDHLASEFPRWDLNLIFSKTGIAQRYVAEPTECASDLGVAAAEKLFHEYDIDPQSIDFLLFCTQTPDYPLPTTACLIQERLGLRTSCGALDFNLGCSGFVYGLAMADGLIRTGSVKRILLLTAETYTKYIDDADRSLRTIFGDGAAATLIDASDEQSLSTFQYGTDGTGADTLLVTAGAKRTEDVLQPRHRQRWKSELYMDGPALINFTVAAIPELIDQILAESKVNKDEIDLFLLHQATMKLLRQIQERLEVDDDRLPIVMEHCGNTVSSTIPILIHDLAQIGTPSSRDAKSLGRFRSWMVLGGLYVAGVVAAIWLVTHEDCVMESLAGYYLISAPQLADPNFARSVVLVIQHGPQGAFGLVLNQTTETGLGELWQQLNDAELDSSKFVNVGGPVDGPLLVLHQDAEHADGQVNQNLFVASQAEYIRHLVENNVEPFRVFSGYSGWGPGQLDSEMDAGGWLTLPSEELDFFDCPPSELWQNALHLTGRQFLQDTLGIDTFPDDSSHN